MNKGQLVAQVASKTGKTAYKTEQALNTVLDGIKHALVHGREVDLGPKLGRLKAIERKRKRVIKKNLVGKYKASVVELQYPPEARTLEWRFRLGAEDFDKEKQHEDSLN